jgi:hypothetical protein
MYIYYNNENIIYKRNILYHIKKYFKYYFINNNITLPLKQKQFFLKLKSHKNIFKK